MSITLTLNAQDHIVKCVDSLEVLARKHSELNTYDKSLETYYKLIPILDSLNDRYNKTRIYNAIGLIHHKLGSDKTSLKFYSNSLLELTYFEDDLLLSHTYNNIGISLESQMKLDSAYYYYLQSIKLKMTVNDSIGISRTYNNLGGIMLQKERYNDALGYYFNSVLIKKALKDTLGLAKSYSNIANIYGWINNLDSTEYYLNKGYKLIELKPNLLLKKLYFHNYSSLFYSRKDYKKAYEFKDSSERIQQKIFHNTLASELAVNEVKFEMEKKNIELGKQKVENELLQEKATKEKWFFLSLTIILVLIIVTGYFIFKNRNQKILYRNILNSKELERKELRLQKEKYKTELLKQEIDLKSNELVSVSNMTLQKQESIDQLNKQINLILEENKQISPEVIKNVETIFKKNVNLELEWGKFKSIFNRTHSDFFSVLNSNFPNLSELDLRHCAYIKIGLSTKEIASLLNIAPSSVQKARVRLKKKLNLSKEQDLYKYIRFELV